MELVALGVAAEIVVIVEDEDARARARRAIELRRRQPADAAAHDHQVVAFAGAATARLRPEIAVAQAMRVLEDAGVAAAQAGEGRRIVSGRVLGRCFAGRGGGEVRQSALP